MLAFILTPHGQPLYFTIVNTPLSCFSVLTSLCELFLYLNFSVRSAVETLWRLYIRMVRTVFKLFAGKPFMASSFLTRVKPITNVVYTQKFKFYLNEYLQVSFKVKFVHSHSKILTLSKYIKTLELQVGHG